MKWTAEAEEAIARVPFFVRRRVRKRVEEEAERFNAPMVTIEHMRSCQKRFLESMDSEVQGYQVETCFGPGGCPNRAIEDDQAATDLENLLASKGLREFLKKKVGGPLKMHHEFRVSVSDCPNACSRPQIADVGLIGAAVPRVTELECSRCGACVDVCAEAAIRLPDDAHRPGITRDRCLACGQCFRVCPTGTLEKGESGYRIVIGGKLGRHPRLAIEIPGVRSKTDALVMAEKCVNFYTKNSCKGERLGEIMEREGQFFSTLDSSQGPPAEK